MKRYLSETYVASVVSFIICLTVNVVSFTLCLTLGVEGWNILRYQEAINLALMDVPRLLQFAITNFAVICASISAAVVWYLLNRLHTEMAIMREPLWVRWGTYTVTGLIVGFSEIGIFTLLAGAGETDWTLLWFCGFLAAGMPSGIWLARFVLLHPPGQSGQAQKLV